MSNVQMSNCPIFAFLKQLGEVQGSPLVDLLSSQLTCGLLSSSLGIADASIALRSRLSQFIENQLGFGRRECTPAELE